MVHGHQVCLGCFLYTLVHLKGLLKWFSPRGHAQGKGYVAPREGRDYEPLPRFGLLICWGLHNAM